MSNSFNNKFTITARLIPAKTKRRSGQPIQKVRFLVAHDTGNPKSTAAQNVQYYINSRNQISASAHLFVDDKEIVECVPALTAPPEKAWHVLYGVPKDNELYGVNANDAAIGVEYCYGGSINADKAYEKYVWLLAKLCFEFGLHPGKDIVGHFFLDPKRKTDPVTGLANSRRTYEQLLRDVVTEYHECITGNVPAPAAPTVPAAGKARVNVKLNMRNAPNTRATVIQVLNPGTEISFASIDTNGQPINNNAAWLKDVNGNYIWSGGVTIL